MDHIYDVIILGAGPAGLEAQDYMQAEADWIP